jgi:apolipoprotein D and lipocalin family protein
MIISISNYKNRAIVHVIILYRNLLRQTTGIQQAVINFGILRITVDSGKYFQDSLKCKDFLVYPLMEAINSLNIQSVNYIIYGIRANNFQNLQSERMIKMGIFSSLFAVNAKNIPAVCDVDLKRYVGRWYEIARLPQKFEEGLECVTATYNLKADGDIEVINEGTRNGVKSVARAVARVPDPKCTGEILVSFFKPFKSKYRIIRLDEEYKYAVVAGGNLSYLWILSREPEISDELYSDLISFVFSKGFDTGKIIKVAQNSR